MRKNSVITLLALGTVLVAGSIMLQAREESATTTAAEPTRPGVAIFEGTVTSAEGSTLVVTTSAGTRESFTVNDSTLFVGSAAPGEAVTVEYTPSTTGTQIAAVVTTDKESASGSAEQPSTETNGDTAGTASDSTMPKTASPLPLIALFGVLSIGAWIALGAIPRLERGVGGGSRR